jgi:hypothetical protein
VGYYRPSSRRRGNVDHLTQSDIFECIQQLHPDGAVVRRDILLELDTAIICDEKVELLLRYR